MLTCWDDFKLLNFLNYLDFNFVVFSLEKKELKSPSFVSNLKDNFIIAKICKMLTP